MGHADLELNKWLLDKWLTSSETIVYDTKSDDLRVDGEGSYRGVVTNKRTIFIQENKIRDVSHHLVGSISWQRIILTELLVLGIILLVVGLIVFYYAHDYGLPNMESYMKYSSYTMISGGVVSIIFFLFHRPETMTISGAGIGVKVVGQRNTLVLIMQEIRNQLALSDERRKSVLREELSEVSGEIPKSVEEVMRLLKVRLAKGEITEEEYLKLKNITEK